MTLDTDKIADSIIDTIKSALAPLHRRIQRLEARVAEMEAKTWSFKGPYTEGTKYTPGHLVQAGGNLWLCQAETMLDPQRQPEGGRSWVLVVRRGRDGRVRTEG